MIDKLTGVLFPPVLPLYFPQPFRSPSRGSFHAFPGLKFYFLSGFLKFFIFFQITCCNFQDFCYNSFCSGVWRSLVARSAGGREVAGSNPVTPIFCFKKDFWKLIPEVLFCVCAPWARSNGCKSRTCPDSGKCIAEQQGCLSRGRI